MANALDVLSVQEAKDWMKVQHDLEDAIIESLIKTAVDHGQKITGRLFYPVVVEGVEIPADYNEVPDGIKTAIKNYVAYAFNNRDNPVAPDGFSQFRNGLSGYRKAWILS